MIRGARSISLRGAALIALAVLGGVLTVPAAGQEPPAVTATYLGLEDRQELKFKYNGAEFTRPVGLLTWNVPTTTLSTMGLDRNFRSFCAEPFVTVNSGNTYGFAIDPVEKPAIYGLPDTEEGRQTAQRKAKFLRELFGRYHADTLPGAAAGPDAKAAFQTAVWEVFQETELPDGPMPLNLFTGTFRANYPGEAAAPPFVQTAQRYVTSLTGNDAVFFENANLAGMELVRLTGLVGANGAVAQAQLAARVRSGASDTAAGALTSPVETVSAPLGPIGVAPIVPTAGFPGGGPGVGFPFFPGFGGSPSVNVPGGSGPSSIAPGGGTTPPGITPPISLPPEIGGSGPGGSGPSTGGNPPGDTPPGGGGEETPPNPIPAPGGLVLGLIGLGLLAARRRRAAAPAAAPAAA